MRDGQSGRRVAAERQPSHRNRPATRTRRGTWEDSRPGCRRLPYRRGEFVCFYGRAWGAHALHNGGWVDIAPFPKDEHAVCEIENCPSISARRIRTVCAAGVL